MFPSGGRKPIFDSFPGDQYGNSVVLLTLVKGWRHLPYANNNINFVCCYLLLTLDVADT